VTRRPTILIVHYTFPGVVGGVETVMAHHARGLSAVAEVRLMAGRGRIGVPGGQSVRIRLLDSLHPRIVEVTRAATAGRALSGFVDLRTRIAAALAPHFAAADRVVLHNVATMALNLPLVAALHDLAPTLPDGRLIVWIHDLAPTTPSGTRFTADDPRRLLTTPLPGARYVAVSDARRALAAQLLGLPARAIRVVPNGIDVAGMLRLSRHTRALEERLSLAAAEPLLVLPARLVRRKRIELAVDAAAELRRRGHPARLVVTGGPDPHDPDGGIYLDELRARVHAAGDRDVLVFDAIGRSADDHEVADLYALADALVFPSSSEGFGLPILEAAADRLPIVCSDLPVLRSLAGSAATYVPVTADGVAFADGVEHALAASPTAQLAGRVRRESDWRHIINEQVIPTILG
jgi:glycosyltransferase involved in cell wall biosynthesis